MSDLTEWTDSSLTKEERVLLAELRKRSAAIARALPDASPGLRAMLCEYELRPIYRRLERIRAAMVLLEEDESSDEL